MTNEPEPNTRAGEAFDPPCTDCGDTGVTFQTERACTCDAATRPLPQPSELVERAKQQIQLGKMTGSHTGSRLNIYQIAEELLTQIAKLQARLEVVPGWSEDADGIACRNDTIKLQDECIAKLQADGDKLALVLQEAKTAIEHGRLDEQMCCSGHMCGCQGSTNADYLLHCLTQALTEWKDPKNA